ncbi:hypothetical protein HIN48_23425, partial [Salmonella enterica subsp. enterica serovar Dublin]|nr:hypothetical protein [Salmonella enterica subsp. enterica serovar Dublin]
HLVIQRTGTIHHQMLFRHAVSDFNPGGGARKQVDHRRTEQAEREMAWRLIRQLSFNYLPLADLDHRTGGQALRDLLNLFIPAHDSPQSRQVRSLPGSGLLVYGRGVSCELTVDEEGFSGISPYLFGLVLEHYIARHVSINTFSQMTLHSMQRGPGRSEPGNGGAYDRRSRPGAENPLALRIPEPDAARGCPAL